MGRLSRAQVELIFFRKKAIRAVFNLDYIAQTNQYFKGNFVTRTNLIYAVTSLKISKVELATISLNICEPTQNSTTTIREINDQ